MSDQIERQEPSSPSDRIVNLLIGAAVVAACFFFWEQAKGILLFLVTLGVLVAIHEWGHFIAAKSVGVTVYEFALGMGPKLLTYMRRNGTDYTVRALPIGGFVNLKGMQPEDPITADGLNGRRPAERVLVYMAGPLMNMILAVVVLCLVGGLVGTPDKSVILVGDVKPKSSSKAGPSPATQMQVVSRNGQPYSGPEKGLHTGDRILEVNGTPVKSLTTVVDTIHGSVGKPITLKVRRHGDELVLSGVPERTLSQEQWPTVQSAPTTPGAVPVQPGDQVEKINGALFDEFMRRGDMPDTAIRRELQRLAGQPVTITVWRNGDQRLDLQGTATPLDVITPAKPVSRYWGTFGFGPVPGQGARIGMAQSIREGVEHMRAIILGFQSLFVHYKTIGNNVGGTIEIWSVISKAADLPPFQYFYILAQLSVSLAIFNLLPIPLLDGGHIFILMVEVLRRRRLEPEAQRVVSMVGLVIIGVLFVAINFKDLMKHFG